jgi:hypothetical protein
VRILAIDWSGDANARRAANRIYLAEVWNGRARPPENGRTRQQVVNYLIESAAAARGDLVVGIDFAFSMPGWYMNQRGLAARNVGSSPGDRQEGDGGVRAR